MPSTEFLEGGRECDGEANHQYKDLAGDGHRSLFVCAVYLYPRDDGVINFAGVLSEC